MVYFLLEKRKSIVVSFDLASKKKNYGKAISSFHMYGYKVKCLLMGELLKMLYCLWKSIKIHHISTTNKLLFIFVLNKTMKCNYVKMLTLPVIMRHVYNIVQY